MKDTYFAYVAGVADSDGSFSFIKRKKQSTKNGYHYRAIFQLTWKKMSNTKMVLDSFKKEFGGNYWKVIRKPNSFDKKPLDCYKYSLEGNLLEKFVIKIIPFLRLKKKHAELILESRKLKGKWGCKGKPDRLWKKEDKLYLLFNKLNTKNKKI